MTDITGGCLCGRMQYTISGEPELSALCHCRNCRRYTGSAFEPVMAFPVAKVSRRHCKDRSRSRIGAMPAVPAIWTPG